jgi:methylated-DNA-[protein]-cysteine S-methyltransferase
MRNRDKQLERQLGLVADVPPETWEALRARFAERAGAEGLLDVAYAHVDSPVGSLIVAATPAGVVRLAFDNEASDAVLTELASRISPRVLEAPGQLERVRRQLEEYFTRRRTTFDLPLDWALVGGFRRQVLEKTARIPYGNTDTYRSVAAAAGSPKAARAAGSALATNPIPIIIPCHRVLPASGALGGYRGGVERKDLLLRLESDPTRVAAGGA